MASFRKRSGGWRAEIAKRGIRESQTFPTKAQAQAWATQREAEILAGVPGHVAGVDSTLSDALMRYKREVSPSKAGQRWEEIRLDKLNNELPFVGLRIGEVTVDQIAEWRDARLKSLKAPSVRREMTLLSSVFEIAKREWRWCSANPVREVKRPGNGRPRDRRVLADEEQRLLARFGYIEGQAPVTLLQELAYAFLIALETAMRQGEILSLTKKNTHLARRYVRLELTKNGDSRDVPLSKRAVDLLAVLVDAAEGDELFKISSGTADAMFRRIRDELGIVDLRFHDTRHEATTRLARKLDVLDLARMTGHRDPRSLMVYYNATATEVAGRLD
ncbi:site-specific integrase [Ectopseudomonas khazarica]|uniref:site-specific integrase n=1 Tax=Ectopseudomonas khazarica TaxID=2502979 RepID=UPI00106F0A3F|nr:site-specific integrase [Pseudomonas khazarica]